MSEITGSLRFVTVDPDGKLHFECNVQMSDPPAKDPLPFIRIERRIDATGKPDGKIEVAGAVKLIPGTQLKGLSSFELTQVDQRSAGVAMWVFDLLLVADTNGKPTTVSMLGRTSKNEPERKTVLLGKAPAKVGTPTPLFNTPVPASKVLAVGPVPRLSVALNEAPVNPQPTDGSLNADAAKHVESSTVAIVSHIVGQLVDQPKFYNAVWGHQTQTVPPTLQPTTTKPEDAEELWARTVSEMLLFLPYGSPIVVSPSRQHTQFDYVPGGIQQRNPNAKVQPPAPFYGLSAACENLATFGVASRGLVPFKRALEAGASAAGVVVSDLGGAWFVGEQVVSQAPQASTGRPVDLPPVRNRAFLLPNGSTTPNQVDLTGMLAGFKPQAGQPFFGPGSVVLFSNRQQRPDDPVNFQRLAQSRVAPINDPNNFACSAVSKEICVTVKDGKPKFVGPWTILQGQQEGGIPLLADHSAGAHIGFVLRVNQDRTQVQFFDTGGLNAPGRKNDVTVIPAVSTFHSGIYDDPLTKTVTSIAAEPYRGAGVFPKPSVSDYATMLNHVKTVLLKARPLGLARLALLQRGVAVTGVSVRNLQTGFLLYLSPAVPMWGVADSDNFALSRYVWSLRDMPGRNAVEPIWMLYAPRFALADAMIDSSRSDTATVLAQAAFTLTATQPRFTKNKVKIAPTTPKNWGTPAAPNIGKILADLTIPIASMTSDPAGRSLILNNDFNNTLKQPRLHLLEGRVMDGDYTSKSTTPPNIRLPMDQAFIFTPGADLSALPAYIHPPGTKVVNP